MPPAGPRPGGLIPARAGSTHRPPRAVAAGAAHPRSRGEHAPETTSRRPPTGSSPLARGARAGSVGDDHRTGSSPLARGAQPPRDRPRRLLRLIPARAGSTWAARSKASPTSAHPRSRGDHCGRCACLRGGSGSSPLARGALRVGPVHAVAGRLIPARAGSTRSAHRVAAGPGAHPRSRGEHPLRVCTRASRRWLIPARAGSTSAQPSALAWPTAHPRSRGEHQVGWKREQAESGSSPLARGAPDPVEARAGRVRLIPARAGSTRRAGGPGTGGPAHPRSRGEHLRLPSVRIAHRGSSPLARGARRHGHVTRLAGRLIPARAGSTTSIAPPRRRHGAHPRSRGEHHPRA